MIQLSLTDGIQRKRIKKTIPDTEWASKAINTQGTVILEVMKKYMKDADISRISIEGIERALSKAGHDMAMHHIRVGIKNLIDRELVARDAKSYLIRRLPGEE